MSNKDESVDKDRGKRLRELRTSNSTKLTQLKLYEELQKILAKKERTEVVENEDGGRVISKFEAGHSLSLRNAIAYSEYFGVSLDYIYGVSNNMKPGYKETKEVLGLSDEAIRNLELLNKTNKVAINTLSKLLSSKLLPLFEELINAYSEHTKIEIKKHLINYPGTVRYDKSEVSPLFLQYINLDSKGLEDFSRETISYYAKKLADQVKKVGDK